MSLEAPVPLASLGSDFRVVVTDELGGTDITDDWAVETDERLVYLLCVFRSIVGGRGFIWYAPDRGRDVKAYLLDTATDGQIIQEVGSECMKDERTANATVTVRRTSLRSGDRLAIDVVLTTTLGARYPMTIGITDASAPYLIAQGVP